MKRLILVILLCSLAVATIFITISCKGKISSSVPIQPGDYIYNGKQWVAVVNRPMTDVDNWGWTHRIKAADFDATAIHIYGNSFKWAQRFSPSEKQVMNSGLGALAVIGMSMYSVRAVELSEGGYLKIMFGSEHPAGEITADKSDFQQGYSLFEFSSLPDSPSGKYCFITDLLPCAGSIKIICLDIR